MTPPPNHAAPNPKSSGRPAQHAQVAADKSEEVVAEHATTKKKVWPWAIAALGVLIAGVVGGMIVNSEFHSPEAAVEEYIEALQAGDGPLAVQLSKATAPEDSKGASTALLDGKPLASTVKNFSDYEYRVLSDDELADDSYQHQLKDHQKVVELSFQTGKKSDQEEDRSNIHFVVERHGKSWIFFDQWELEPVELKLVSLQPKGLPEGSEQDAPTGKINGTDIPLLASDGNASQALVFPPAQLELDYQGTYIKAEKPHRLLISNSHKGPLPFGLTMELTDEVNKKVQEQVDSALARCTEQQVLKPTGCPFGYSTPNRVTPDSIKWSIPGEPKVEFNWVQNRPSIESITATAHLEVEEINLANGARETTEYRQPFELEAGLELTPEYISVTPEWE